MAVGGFHCGTVLGSELRFDIEVSILREEVEFEGLVLAGPSLDVRLIGTWAIPTLV